MSLSFQVYVLIVGLVVSLESKVPKPAFQVTMNEPNYTQVGRPLFGGISCLHQETVVIEWNTGHRVDKFSTDCERVVGVNATTIACMTVPRTQSNMVTGLYLYNFLTNVREDTHWANNPASKHYHIHHRFVYNAATRTFLVLAARLISNSVDRRPECPPISVLQILEIDFHGRIVWHWDMMEHLYTHHLFQYQCHDIPNKLATGFHTSNDASQRWGKLVDEFLHANSIAWDEATDSIHVYCVYPNMIFKIDKTTKRVLYHVSTHAWPGLANHLTPVGANGLNPITDDTITRESHSYVLLGPTQYLFFSNLRGQGTRLDVNVDAGIAIYHTHHVGFEDTPCRFNSAIQLMPPHSVFMTTASCEQKAIQVRAKCPNGLSHGCRLRTVGYSTGKNDMRDQSGGCFIHDGSVWFSSAILFPADHAYYTAVAKHPFEIQLTLRGGLTHIPLNVWSSVPRLRQFWCTVKVVGYPAQYTFKLPAHHAPAVVNIPFAAFARTMSATVIVIENGPYRTEARYLITLQPQRATHPTPPFKPK
eukprot:NODE_1412_length_1745_cov_86.180641_g1342_i0.p1 GENE.NODE_1412_length_1745_cov_86.180641_g1342_i0~~NODE_1412_length_1745_cov_86.180641_g1342_i0.p1  ORF type:complete len:532 (-),score=34.09 NODE_1412_length_1745_cov_86.180641_g1342_i0:101-1696(-)